MFCSKCGKPVPERVRFCPYCGASCVGRDGAEGRETERKVSPDGQKKLSVGKKKKALWFIPAAAVLLIIAIIGVLFVARQMNVYQQYREQLSLGEQYMEELDYEAAIVVFEEAIRIDPKREEAYLALAGLYEEIGRPEKAVAVLEKALEQLGQSASDELISCLEKAADRMGDAGEADADAVWTEEGTSGTAESKADREEDKREETGEEPDFLAGSLFGGKLTDKYGTYFQYKNTYELDIYPDPDAEGKEPEYPNGVDVEGEFPFTIRDEWVSRQGETYVFREGDVSSPWIGVGYTQEDWTSSGISMFFVVDTQNDARVVSLEQRWGEMYFYGQGEEKELKKEETPYLVERIIVSRGKMLDLEYAVEFLYDKNGINFGYGIYTPETRAEDGYAKSYTSEFFTLYKSDGSGEYSSFEEAQEALQRKWKELGLAGKPDAIAVEEVHSFGMFEKNVPEQIVNEEGVWNVSFTLYSNAEPAAKEESGRTDRSAQGGPFLREWDGNREQASSQWDRRIVGSWETAEEEPMATRAVMQIMEDGEVMWNPSREELRGQIEGADEGKIVTGSLTGSYYNNATASWEENTWAGRLEMEYDEAQDVLTCWYYDKDSSVRAVYELRRTE